MLMNNAGKLVTTEKEKAEVLNKFSLQSSQATCLPTPLERVNEKIETAKCFHHVMP